jgi:hypothetical protein
MHEACIPLEVLGHTKLELQLNAFVAGYASIQCRVVST